MTQTIIWTIAILTSVGLLLAVFLWFVAEKFKVEEDPRIDQIEGVLPGANCGGCGYAGCRAFAESAVKAGNLDNHFCSVGGNSVMKDVADILGIAAVEKTRQVATFRCNGTCEVRAKASTYDGWSSCNAEASLYTGETLCVFGCLGLGDCVDACKFGALSLDPQTGLPSVDQERCTACGACVKTCPKHLIELRNYGPRGMRMYVTCRNEEKGPVAKKACANACIGCGICAKTCQHGAITVENNVAYIDYSKCKLCRECEAMCPTGAIHAVNFPKPLDKEAVKARVNERNKKAREAAAAAKAASAVTENKEEKA